MLLKLRQISVSFFTHKIVKISLLVIACGILAATLFWASLYLVSPEQRMRAFFDCLQKGKAREAALMLGSAGCSCTPPGGWNSYLSYTSGQEPNLAFLLCQNFKTESVVLGAERIDEKVKLGVHRDLTVQVRFDPEHAPYLLPVKMAFGSSISEAELNQFATNPLTEGGRGMTLRLRPGLAEGSVSTPKDLHLWEPKDAQNKEQMEAVLYDPEALGDLFGQELTLFLSPKDAGPVLCSDGTQLPLEDVARKLPRLDSAVLKLNLIRSPRNPDWKIMRCELHTPVFKLERKTSLAFDLEKDVSM